MAEFVPPTTIAESIEQAAINGVKKGSEEGREFENFAIDDLIKADRHLASKRASVRSHFGLRMTKCIPPGGG
jgi:hypothetical protein